MWLSASKCAKNAHIAVISLITWQTSLPYPQFEKHAPNIANMPKVWQSCSKSGKHTNNIAITIKTWQTCPHCKKAFSEQECMIEEVIIKSWVSKKCVCVILDQLLHLNLHMTIVIFCYNTLLIKLKEQYNNKISIVYYQDLISSSTI